MPLNTTGFFSILYDGFLIFKQKYGRKVNHFCAILQIFLNIYVVTPVVIGETIKELFNHKFANLLELAILFDAIDKVFAQYYVI